MTENPPIAIRNAKLPSRRRWLPKLALAVIVALVAGVVAIVMGVKKYLRSDGFRVFAGDQASQVLKSQAEFSPLRWYDSSASAEKFTALGGPGAPFSRLQADSVRVSVDLGALWDKTWRVPRIDIEKLSVDFSAAPANGGGAVQSTSPFEPDAGSKVPDSPSWLARWIPNKLRIDEIDVAAVSLHYARGGEEFRVDDLPMTLRPADDGTVEADGKGGRLTFLNGRKFAVDQLAARLAGGTVYLTEVTAHSTDGGTQLRIAGEVGDKINLQLTFSNVGAAELLAQDWKKKLNGKLAGEATITGETAKPDDILAEGHLEFTDGRLEFLPLLDNIASHTKNDNFRHLIITKARANFRRRNGRTEVRQFAMESPNLLRMDGQLDVVAGQLAGSFQVGIPPGTLRWVPGAESKVFTRRENGFLWTTMRVAGPVDSPGEDLSGRLTDAAIAQTIEDVPKKAVEYGTKAVDTATDVGSKVIDGTGKLIEKGADLLKGFVPFLK